MRLIPLISLATAVEISSSPEYVFSNPPESSLSDHRIPTSYESAVLGRRILALTPLGTVATVFPESSGLEGMPHSLMEYVADCEEEGNPTFLAINIASTFKNVRAGSNISLAQAWTPPFPPDERIQSSTSSSSFLSRLFSLSPFSSSSSTTSYSAANLPRFSLLGYIEPIPSSHSSSYSSSSDLAKCFIEKHPDAKYWLPGNKIHESSFVRLVVQKVYWIGGFGDRAYIGWIPVDEWRNVTREEWEGVELPGERKGWKEWSYGNGHGLLGQEQILGDL
ncbi:pyridoxamine 5'-phosphate oxidase-domain-containing protein [Poronia punctata]|nr:pyridoxamine 5'-phosphate oxidase-domain-containing protein [Poronia punctata]